MSGGRFGLLERELMLVLHSLNILAAEIQDSLYALPSVLPDSMSFSSIEEARVLCSSPCLAVRVSRRVFQASPKASPISVSVAETALSILSNLGLGDSSFRKTWIGHIDVFDDLK